MNALLRPGRPQNIQSYISGCRLTEFVQGKDTREDIILSKYIIDLSETSRGEDFMSALYSAELRETKNWSQLSASFNRPSKLELSDRQQISSHHINPIINIKVATLLSTNRDVQPLAPPCKRLCVAALALPASHPTQVAATCRHGRCGFVSRESHWL